MLSVVSKVYGRVLIKWIREDTEDVICEVAVSTALYGTETWNIAVE